MDKNQNLKNEKELWVQGWYQNRWEDISEVFDLLMANEKIAILREKVPQRATRVIMRTTTETLITI